MNKMIILVFEKSAYKGNQITWLSNSTVKTAMDNTGKFLNLLSWIKIIESIVIVTYQFALIHSFAEICSAVSNKTIFLGVLLLNNVVAKDENFFCTNTRKDN